MLCGEHPLFRIGNMDPQKRKEDAVRTFLIVFYSIEVSDAVPVTLPLTASSVKFSSLCIPLCPQ